MFGKKKEPENLKIPIPIPNDTNTIKQNIGEVSNSGMRDMGMNAPPRPPAPLPPANRAPLGSPMYSETDDIYDPEPPRRIPRSNPRHDYKPAPLPKGNDISPPLFIKIDRYNELARNISELKSHALSVRDALDALNDIEKEIKNAIDITQIGLDNVTSTIALIDTKLLKIGRDDSEEVMEIPREMDDYMKSLYDNMERIRHELHASRR